MTRRETVGIMAILQTAYPAFYAKQDDQERKEAAALWFELFADDDPNLVGAAVKALIVGGGAFPPSIGEIKQKMFDLTHEKELSETEAWALVSKACANGYYGYKEEFAKLPPAVQAAVGRPEQLKEWSNMSLETVESVIASNFMRGYKTILRRQKEDALLPESVKTLIGGIADKMMLGGHVDDETI